MCSNIIFPFCLFVFLVLLLLLLRFGVDFAFDITRGRHEKHGVKNSNGREVERERGREERQFYVRRANKMAAFDFHTK